MQNFRHVRLTPGAQTGPLISLYRHLRDLVLSGNQTKLFQTRSEGLATQTKGSTNNGTEAPNADLSRDGSKTQEESPKPSPAAAGITKGHEKYYSLKAHRQGPNTESGELNPDVESKQVKDHNKATANRYEKR
ncbi:uncharacterized protein N7446_005121 [Penicillium canescens]|uniref:Uncharacterized protein n=1 Tax=Penicillium canescens TaxID=5083 RepID=A0AAD6N7B2_PENCN|nr:uncharacterized protein N7446_005121 [Penicillium canescens]KAJ6038311.1 hypothetical protein N7460_008082 [Penicillium canescens]KAJ6039571.1 hypothetical protein N7444_008476 [Penicillium canescens]KAJ6068084.1 hypothetical protein N7446_005121 [Penicillium canescens]